jgi:hypothetical protein
MSADRRVPEVGCSRHDTSGTLVLLWQQHSSRGAAAAAASQRCLRQRDVMPVAARREMVLA